jgi:molybdenum cofactor biosynthesis enzyme MoaA
MTAAGIGGLRFYLDRGYQLRFIDQMPLDAQHGGRRTDMITADEILAAMSAGFSLTPPIRPAGDQHPPRPSWSIGARTRSA